MNDRIVELVAMGPELRKQAESKGKSVTEAHYLVHEILARAFNDLDQLPAHGLRDHVAAALERKLGGQQPQPRPQACRRTGVLRARRVLERMPDVRRLIANADALPRIGAFAGTC
jgi:hypothetical protein